MLDRLEGVDQHENVERQIVANVEQHHGFEYKSERNGHGDRSFLAAKKPSTM